MKRVSILGSTGSIGVQTLKVIDVHQDRFTVAALSAGTNIELLKAQIDRYHPRMAAVSDEHHAAELRTLLGGGDTEIIWGVDGYRAIAGMADADVVMSAIVGAAGLIPTLAAIEAGKRVALANKETMVMAGAFITESAKKSGASIMPVDSEHSAIFQCLCGHRKDDVKRLILTASGGPFHTMTREEIGRVTVEDALAHPNWEMGKKVTIDSATLMNKGLEVIEARWFFDIDVERIDVLIHPRSIVHSMVEYIDGSIIAQLGIPDMRIPILYALAYPERLPSHMPSLDLAGTGALEFYLPDVNRFPALALAYRAAKEGGAAPALLNAANETAVEAFLTGGIPFTRIAGIVGEVLNQENDTTADTIDDILRADRRARERARTLIENEEHHK
ncbi:MAG: 1-deoxy-D-xylulose-5-phosphate reductoisomerase [Deltaproteobacteria bacterium]|nr:1-deoxy-D-xylulose-5-phosphate reductoisomerase [Deltaproteobacteria bacterium]